MKYFEMFTGIAGFSKGIEQAYEDIRLQRSKERRQDVDSISLRRSGESIESVCERHVSAYGHPECIGFSEIGKTANAILRYLYPNIRNYGDASRIVCDELPDFDFLVGGFPCQAFSIAGKRKGFADTRGTLFFEIARILEAKRPGHFLLENVAGLLSHDNGQTFRTIIATLDALGYDVEWTVINSKHFGVPQNRERVFIVGHIRGGGCGQVFSIGEGDGEAVRQGYVEPISGTISTKNQSGQCQFDGSTTLILGKDGKRKPTDIAATRTAGGHSGGNHSDMDLITVGTLRTHKDGEGFREMQSNVSPSLNAGARQEGSQQPVIAVPLKFLDRNQKNYQGDYSFTVDTVNSGGIQRENRIRRLTPIECMRLQGFADDHCDFGINEKGDVYAISDTGKYQCAGNAVTVNVIEAITAKMLEAGCLG